MTTFVLVHGGFGSPAELVPVIPELEALGHHAIAVDLPCTDAEATIEDYGRTVVDATDGLLPPIVVVGHSAGGATISLRTTTSCRPQHSARWRRAWRWSPSRSLRITQSSPFGRTS